MELGRSSTGRFDVRPVRRPCWPEQERVLALRDETSRTQGARVRGTRLNSCVMKMPGGDAAIVDRQKLTGYCLNPEHPRGKHKARVFATLGFTAENADELRAALLIAAASASAQPATSDQFGDRYVLEFEIEGPQGNGIVKSTWIVRRGESAPRLTSCFVK
jgi:hypothetical protein